MIGELSIRLAAMVVTCVLHLFVQILVLSILCGLFWLFLPQPGAAIFFLILVGAPLVAVFAWFLVSSWPLKKNGTTLGMRWFGLKVVSGKGAALCWKELALREGLLVLLVASGLGLPLAGILALLDKDRLTWWDRVSGTQVVQTPAVISIINEARARSN